VAVPRIDRPETRHLIDTVEIPEARSEPRGEKGTPAADPQNSLFHCPAMLRYDRSMGLVSDTKDFLLHVPPIPTLIEFDSDTAREDFSHRIAQRLGIDVAQYAILNIHRIGIEAPTRHVFEELLHWDGRPAYWPNHIVQVIRTIRQPQQLEFFLLGKRKTLFGIKSGILGLDFIPLFRMDAVAVQRVPSESNFDNARYLLYECSGGYPVGICGIYVRSPIANLGETEPAQVFFAVGFNFYGKGEWSRPGLIRRVWEGIHNRVTTNVLNRFKNECESTFQRVQAG